MIIIGAGLTGMLCGALNPGSTVYEAGSERPNDHKAVLRMRNPKIGELLGIKFDEVTVYKSIWYDNGEVQPSPRFAHMYSQKVAEVYSSRSIFNLKPAQRFIPPPNFAAELKKRCHIEYEYRVTRPWDFDCDVVSTIPMPALAKLSSIDVGCDFFNFPVVVNRYRIQNCKSHCTVYYPDPGLSIYRASITNSDLIIESVDNISEDEFYIVCKSMGVSASHVIQVIDNHKQEAGKIREIPSDLRENFISSMTIKHNVYSLGRYATWRPKVMLDDIVDDVFVIRRLINQGAYASINHVQGDK